MDVIDRKLPHKAPVRFIKKVEVEGENHAVSLVEFTETPTLSAVVEASAQNVIFILSLYRDYDGGVLTGMKNIELFELLHSGVYRVESRISTQLESFCMLNFRLSKEERTIVKGEMSIVMRERDEALN
ncbi:hypothetical protein GSY74_06455 [Sulfurovum sp. bin170]|uniref:hypothetical protein n=1 Tax=Sulfurovum sp. bin170 TaxID=2695268 RepID=UPI0013DEA79F|nr:hypothetical protein [Sulfurovum sp. bin170]NEW60921.1 hypothetical protein [Sulfurovum sp. bin170]